MKVCKYCNSECDDTEKACHSCGASEFSNKCRNCGTAFDSGFCPNCGVKVGHKPQTCPKCGNEYYTNACPNCGYNGRQPHFRHHLQLIALITTGTIKARPQ